MTHHVNVRSTLCIEYLNYVNFIDTHTQQTINLFAVIKSRTHWCRRTIATTRIIEVLTQLI